MCVWVLRIVISVSNLTPEEKKVYMELTVHEDESLSQQRQQHVDLDNVLDFRIVETAADAGRCAFDDDYQRIGRCASPCHRPMCWFLASLD